MTPQEKAKELIDKYKNYALSTGVDENDLSFNDLTQCALIAVQEIILSNPHSNPFNTDVYPTMSYWQDVKKEIEKL
jgi:hypothetical protein